MAAKLLASPPLALPLDATMPPGPAPTVALSAKAPPAPAATLELPVTRPAPAAPPMALLVETEPVGPAPTFTFSTTAPAAPAATLELPATAAPSSPPLALPVDTEPVGPAPTRTFSTRPAADNPSATLDFPSSLSHTAPMAQWVDAPAPAAVASPSATHPLPDDDTEVPTAPLPTRIGRFEIRQQLGQGAFGVVYRALDPHLDREVALKVAKPHTLNTEQRVKRFLREAKAAANLRHPNIVPVFDSGRDGDHHYIASAFIPGQTLAGALEDRPNGLPPRRSAEIVRKLADALAYAHGKGVVHRDVKPANVMLDEQDDPMLLDFGLAARAEGDEKLTQEATAMGTPAYMAPEQAAGQASPASDQYSLGCLLYELLTGHTPFAGPPEIQLFLHQTQEPPAPRALVRTLPRDLDTICMKALAKEPAKRYASTQLLAQDLERFLSGEPIRARPESAVRKVARALWRRRAVVGGAAASLVAVIAVLVGVSQAYEYRQRAALESALQAGLRRPAAEWTVSHVEALEGKIADLEARAPEQAAPYRRMLTEEYPKAVAKVLDQPRLEDADVARLRENLKGLGSRTTADQVKRLGELLEDRLRKPETAFDLKPPFAQAKAVLPTAALDIAPGAMQLRSLPDGQGQPVVLTEANSSGQVQVKATFATVRVAAPMIGVVLNSEPQKLGYAFVLSCTSSFQRGDDDVNRATESPGRRKETAATLSESIGGGYAYLQIRRHNSCLREQRVVAPSGPVEFRVGRNDRELTVQLVEPGRKEAPKEWALKFEDTFPLPATGGRFGLYWPVGASVQALEASRLRRPRKPSPLEQADDLYAAGQAEKALAAYQEQALTSDAQVAQEARYKAAECLMDLKRYDEAGKEFERVAGQDGDRWPAMAACRLWLVKLKQKDYTGAEQVLTALSARYPFEQLLSILPEDTRQGIVDRYVAKTTLQVNAIIPDATRVPALERARRALDYLGAPMHDSLKTYFSLVRAYQLEDKPDKAAAVAREWIKRCDSLSYNEHFNLGAEVLCDYCWLLRTQGRAEEALRELDHFIKPLGDALPEPAVRCQVERARTLAALNRWPEAEKTLAACLPLAEQRKLSYQVHAQVCLLHGFLCERRGDAAAAKAAWKRALFSSYAQKPKDGPLGSVVSEIDNLIAGGLTDETSDAEADATLQSLIGQFQGLEMPVNLVELMKFSPGVLRKMWQSPVGRDSARGMVFREMPFGEYPLVPLGLLFLEWFKDGAFGGTLSPEQQDLMRQAFRTGWVNFKAGHFTKGQLLRLGLTWQGTNNFLGWGAVKDSLKPELRGPIAYLLGNRYLQLGRPADAKDFLRTAVKDAANDSPLQKLAQSALEGVKD